MKKWETLRGCTLAEWDSNDGDSFKIRHGKKLHVFRLYEVDCAETTDDGRGMAERVAEQARVFYPILSLFLPWLARRWVLARGKKAAAFTRSFFWPWVTVRTRWEDGLGQAKGGRSLCYIKSWPLGRDLGEALLRAGLARRRGKKGKGAEE